MKLNPRQQAIRDEALHPPQLQRPVAPTLCLADVLVVLAPRDPASRRRKLFAVFIATDVERVLIVTGEEFTDGKIALLVQNRLDEFEQDGIPLGLAQSYAAALPAWRKAKVSAGRAKGGRALQEQNAAKRKATAATKAEKLKKKAPSHRVSYHPPEELVRIAREKEDSAPSKPKIHLYD